MKVPCTSYEEFDQKQNHGWRVYAEQGNFFMTSKQILQYSEENKGKLSPEQSSNLKWHAGQMYAYMNSKTLALKYFRRSLTKQEPPHAPVRWNDYVMATIAFLEKDKIKLEVYRGKIASGKEILINGRRVIPNLEIVDNMLKYFDKSYLEVYSINIHDPRKKNS